VLEGLPLVLERRSRPEFPQFARRRMELPFAVQLMRQSYAAVDALKFVPSDSFQKSFFLYRQSEWDDYRTHFNSGVMQGELNDPIYFDHVSYCQYAVIADKMRRGQQSFVQLIDANGTAQSIRRDPLLTNNDLLPAAHSKLVGDAILDYILATYPSIAPKVPFSNSTQALRKPPNAEDSFLHDAQDTLDVFQLNGYALDMKIEALPTRTQPSPALFGIRVVGPCNLWGSQVLRRRGDVPVNDFEIKVLQSLARRRGLDLQLVSSTVSENARVLHVVKVE